MLYPQNGDRIVTIDSVTSRHLIYKFTARGSSSALVLEVCGCVLRCRQLHDLHINSMTYTLFFIPDYLFQKVFLCFLR